MHPDVRQRDIHTSVRRVSAIDVRVFLRLPDRADVLGCEPNHHIRLWDLSRADPVPALSDLDAAIRMSSVPSATNGEPLAPEMTITATRKCQALRCQVKGSSDNGRLTPTSCDICMTWSTKPFSFWVAFPHAELSVDTLDTNSGCARYFTSARRSSHC